MQPPAALVRFATILFTFISKVVSDQHEYRLYQDLLQNYNPLVRPVENNSHPLVIELGVALQQIIGVDEKNQVVEINAWITYSWNDYQLAWEPQEYGGVTDIRFTPDRIWKPDVLLYNSVDPNFDSTYKSHLVVYSGGFVNWVPPGIFKISCKIDITWFPFDDQNCYMKFGSWTYHGFALDLQNSSFEMDMSEYQENGEWALLGTPVERSTKYYDCCPEPYFDLKFFLNIRRRTLYYGFNLIIPSFIISLMTVLGFTLPPDAGEKITLEITILLSVCFFLSIVSGMTPHTSEAVPLIGAFFTCCMLVVSASVVFTVVVLNLHYRTPDTHEMSPFVRAVLLEWLPWILRMHRPGHEFGKESIFDFFRKSSKENESESLMRNVRNQENGSDVSSSSDRSKQLPQVPDTHEIATPPSPYAAGALGRRPSCSRLTVNIQQHRRVSVELDAKISQSVQPMLSKPGVVDPGVHALILMMQRIHSELKFITKRMEKEDEDADAEADWKYAAMVVDRLCLIIFSIFIIGSTCGIMFSAPHLVA